VRVEFDIKGTEVPGITFDAILILCSEWYSKYRSEKWDDAYKQLATILGYCNSSMIRYKDFFKYGLISIGWLKDNKLTEEARVLLKNLSFHEIKGRYGLTGNITLFDRKEQKKKRKTFSIFIRYSDLHVIKKSISRNACIKILLNEESNNVKIDKQMITNVLSSFSVFTKNSTTIPRRASDVYNWICWLQRIDKLIRPGTTPSEIVS